MDRGSFDHWLDAADRRHSADTTAERSPEALFGVTRARSEMLCDALGVATLAELAAHPYVLRAQSIHQRAQAIGHDLGPGVAWSQLFADAPLASYQQNPEQFRLDFGPVYYRGRLDGTARVLIVGQDPAPNELIGHRAFVGASGQRIQALLRRIGMTHDYLMVNTFIYPVFGQFNGRLRQLSREGDILDYRNRMFDYIDANNPIDVIIAAGAAAQDAVARWQGSVNHIVHNIAHPSARDPDLVADTWNAALLAIRDNLTPQTGAQLDDSLFGSPMTDEDYEPIPRYDLPFGMPEWHGVGSHASRGRLSSGHTDHTRIIWEST